MPTVVYHDAAGMLVVTATPADLVTVRYEPLAGFVAGFNPSVEITTRDTAVYSLAHNLTATAAGDTSGNRESLFRAVDQWYAGLVPVAMASAFGRFIPDTTEKGKYIAGHFNAAEIDLESPVPPLPKMTDNRITCLRCGGKMDIDHENGPALQCWSCPVCHETDRTEVCPLCHREEVGKLVTISEACSPGCDHGYRRIG